MSELNNPLFEDRREFLERQKEEYKNALLSDVAELKDQSQAIGKKVLLAGGLLAGIYLLSKALHSNGGDKPKKKKKGNRLENPARFKGAEDRAWISSIPELEDDEPLYSAIERTYPAIYHPSTGTLSVPEYGPKEEPSMLKAFFKSDIVKVLEQQLAAILMVYLTKMIEKHVSSSSSAEQPVLVEEVTTQVEYQVEPDQSPNAQPPQS